MVGRGRGLQNNFTVLIPLEAFLLLPPTHPFPLVAVSKSNHATVNFFSFSVFLVRTTNMDNNVK